MKKCVRCGTRFEDSVLKCPDCQLYLIKDTVGDMTFGDDIARTGRRTSVHDPDPSMRGNMSASPPPCTQWCPSQKEPRGTCDWGRRNRYVFARIERLRKWWFPP